METPLRGRSGGHTGTAPTVSFGGLRVGRLVSFGWIARKWLFCLCKIAWKNITGIGRGGACVPARVALQGRIHHSIPRTQCVYFWYGNAAVRTFGRARRHRPYGFVWILRTDVAPTISNIIFLCVTVLTEDKKISKYTYISLRDCYIIAHRNNWYD